MNIKRIIFILTLILLGCSFAFARSQNSLAGRYIMKLQDFNVYYSADIVGDELTGNAFLDQHALLGSFTAEKQ